MPDKKEDTRTPEQKKADQERMAKVRAARQEGNKQPDTVQVPKADFDALKAEVQALKSEGPSDTDEAFKRLVELLSVRQGAQVSGAGVQGAVELASTNPNDYPNPVERIYKFCEQDPRLSRFNVRENYHIEFIVQADSYKKDNVSYRYPRFVVELSKYLFNTDGSPRVRTNKQGKEMRVAAFRGRSIQKAENEIDVWTAIEKLGLKDQIDPENVMNEFRFWRVTQWIAEKILPPSPVQFENKVEEEVIDNEMVEIREYEKPVKTSVFGV